MTAAPGPGLTAWFHCFSGIAGDMALGALLDAGADLDEVRSLVARLPITGWALDTEAVRRGGLAATRAVVRVDDEGSARTHGQLSAMIGDAALPERLAKKALAAFAALATIEGRLHGQPPAEVHFHEVGGHDAVVDVVGTFAALEVLGVDVVTASAVATGTGTVRSAHGVLPVPAPAVVELLRGAPLVGKAVDVELTTPTGAAILAASVSSWGPLPAMTVGASGFGAGTRQLDDLPNCTQVVIGTASSLPAGTGQPVVLLETNVDDVTGETLAHAAASLLEAGAHDTWLTPVVMKKGRPGQVLSALVDPAVAEDMALRIRHETGSLGVRAHSLERWPAPRSVEVVQVGGHAVRVKVSSFRAKAEHEDAAAAARSLGLPIGEVGRLAEAAWHDRRHHS